MSTAKTMICCCVAESWTKVIASWQIIAHFIYLVQCSVGLPNALSKLDKLKGKYTDSELIKAGIKLTFAQTRHLVKVFMILCIIISAVGLLFGILLFIGAYKKNRALLNTWIALNIFLVVGIIVIPILESSYMGTTEPASIARCVWSILLLLWTIWVVTIFKRESCDQGLSGGAIGEAPISYLSYPGPGPGQNQFQQQHHQIQLQQQQGQYLDQNGVKLPPAQWNTAPWKPV